MKTVTTYMVVGLAFGALAGCQADRGATQEVAVFGVDPEIGEDERYDATQDRPPAPAVAVDLTPVEPVTLATGGAGTAGGPDEGAVAPGAGGAGQAGVEPVECVPAPPLTVPGIAGGAVTGRLLSATSDEVRLADQDGNVYELEIDPEAIGQEEPPKVARLREGATVRASFVLTEGGMVLYEIGSDRVDACPG